MNEQEIKQIAKYIQPKLQEFMVGDTISSLKKRIISAIKNKDIIALADLGIEPNHTEFNTHPEGAVLKWYRYQK